MRGAREVGEGSDLDRRSLLRRLAGIGVWLWAGAPFLLALGCSHQEPACHDPEMLSTPERSARAARGYVDRSPEGEARSCGGCAFFERGGAEGCGRCALLAGPVSAAGVCDAWTARTTG
jgi:hypothetical protein